MMPRLPGEERARDEVEEAGDDDEGRKNRAEVSLERGSAERT